MELEQQTIKALLQCPWLENCGSTGVSSSHWSIPAGRPNTYLSPSQLERWDQIRLEARGDATSLLAKTAPAAFNGNWNRLMRQAKSQILPQIKPLILEQLTRLSLPDVVYTRLVAWDIPQIAVLCSFRTYLSSALYEHLLGVYATGHLPCGWEGPYPAGRLAVW